MAKRLCNCLAPVAARGLCDMHYQRWLRMRKQNPTLPPRCALDYVPKHQRSVPIVIEAAPSPAPVGTYAQLRNCRQCERRFTARAPSQRFCDLNCFAASPRLRPEPQVNRANLDAGRTQRWLTCSVVSPP
jgi:hypothetical protein